MEGVYTLLRPVANLDSCPLDEEHKICSEGAYNSDNLKIKGTTILIFHR
jgi:hypothetical protein